MIWNSSFIDRYDWHDWFAWYPVIVDVWIVHGSTKTLYVRKKVWLKTIRRKFTSHYADDDVEYSLGN